ncbi:CaiB/BaiF CoA transferase family protein [Jiangella asiatica]|uniref:CoA transferase n=1 Tax=Jiangella asiatica TaxID=2530372 RepID=A0A4R5CR87_9ACTN|nr:CoA transferase [Jiangella asiatica]TDE00143.1 CoA transferase [Jiangella asiatica]
MTGPLAGVRVLDLTHFVAGPWCTQTLADLGADVVKVEPPGRGEIGRSIGAVYSGAESAVFLSCNRGKRAVALDLKRPTGQRIVQAMARDVDVVVHNFRPGTVDRLGVGPVVLRRANPGLIHCAISAFGNDGPAAARPANDPVIQAISGAMHESGRAAGAPVRMGVSLPDFAAAALAAGSIMAALLRRRRTGQGCVIDLNLLDAQLYAQVDRMTGAGEAPEAEPAHEPGVRGSYVCAAGDALWLECDDGELAGRALGISAGTARGLRDHLALTCRDAALRAFEAAGVTAAPVQDLSDVLPGPPTRTVRVAHPIVGDLNQLRTPFDADPPWPPATIPPPLLGEHTEAVLRELRADNPTDPALCPAPHNPRQEQL